MNIRKAATEAARIIRRGNRANVMADGTVWESVGPFGLIDNEGHQTHPIWYNRVSSPCQGLTIADITRIIREALFARRTTMNTYILRSFDGRQSLPQTFTSLAAAKRAARRIFGWQRLYATPWYAMCGDEDDQYMAIQLAEKPSLAGEAIDAPVIERHTCWRRRRTNGPR